MNMARRNTKFGKMSIRPDAALSLIVGNKKTIGPADITRSVWDYIRKKELLYDAEGKKVKYDPKAIERERKERKKAEEKRRIARGKRKIENENARRETNAELAELRRKALTLERMKKKFGVK